MGNWLETRGITSFQPVSNELGLMRLHSSLTCLKVTQRFESWISIGEDCRSVVMFTDPDPGSPGKMD